MRHFILLVFISILFLQGKTTSNLTGRKTVKEPLDIYLCIGQSNMAGRAQVEDQDLDSIPNALLFNGVNFEKAANPMNKYSTIRKQISMQRLSPSYTFAQEMASASNGEKKIGLIVNAKGGTSINEWESTDSLYIKALMQTKKALEFGELKGVIWHQGESDVSKYNEYLPKISTLINSLRNDFGIPNLPFVAGQTSADKDIRIPFNDMLLKLPDLVKHTAVVTSENTTTFDKTHFDSESQRLLGQRYAIEMMKLMEQN